MARLGRWTSEDPIGFAADDANLWRYVRNSVTILIDPSGFQFISGGSSPVSDTDVSSGGISSLFGEGGFSPPWFNDRSEVRTSYGVLKWRIASAPPKCIFQAWFFPDPRVCRAKELGFVQVVKGTLGDQLESSEKWQQPFITNDGYMVDILNDATNPFYQLIYNMGTKSFTGLPWDGPRDEPAIIVGGFGRRARMEDYAGETSQARSGRGTVVRSFETCVVDLNTGEVLTCLKWGFSIAGKPKSPQVILCGGRGLDMSGNPSQQWINPDVSDQPSQQCVDAINKFNDVAKNKKGWIQFPTNPTMPGQK